jgi:methionyl aminopeptidase
MAFVKTRSQIDLMRESGRIVAKTLRLVSEQIRVGITPKELDAMADDLIRSEGGVPSFLNYRNYPAATCISVNQVVVHGIPTAVPLEEGDIVSLDFGVVKNGWHADGAWTYPVGQISREAERLLKVTQESLNQGIAKARPGNRIGDISATIQKYCESNGYGVVRDLVGHGIGQALHEAPHSIPNFGKAGKGELLREGMTICIEPMINMGTYKVIQLLDKWTVEAADGQYSAHFEHTVAILKDSTEILTRE